MRDKKKIIIFSSLAIVLVITVIILFAVLNNKPEEDTATQSDSSYEDIENNNSELEEEDEDDDSQNDLKLPGKILGTATITSSADVSQLDGYDSVNSLTLMNTDISDFSFLSDINVRNLFIRENKHPVDLSFVNETYLEALTIVICDVKDLSVISDFKNLKTFDYIFDSPSPGMELDFLAKCSKLQNINLQNVSFTDCSFIKNMNKLESFTAYRCGIDDLTPFKNCSYLRELTLITSAVSDLSPIKDLNLTTLKVEESMLSDVSPLERMSQKSLRTLSLKDNYITDVSALKSGNRLSFVDLSSNMISQFPSQLISVGSLDLSYNNISYISESDILKIKKHNTSLNLFDTMIDEATLTRLGSMDSVYFSTQAAERISTSDAIEYTKKMKEALEFCDKGSDAEKVLRAVYYICQNTRLDNSLSAPHKDDAYGALLLTAVCGGTTDLTNSLCKHMGIEASRYHGDFEDPDDFALHVWTVVNIDGQHYHCDAMQSMAFYDSYGMPLIALVSDEEVKTYGHLLIAENIPRCRNSVSGDLREEIIQSILNE